MRNKKEEKVLNYIKTNKEANEYLNDLKDKSQLKKE